MRFELVEIDPATGEEDQVLSLKPQTMTQCEREMTHLIEDMQEDWEEGGEWSWLMIRPAR